MKQYTPFLVLALFCLAYSVPLDVEGKVAFYEGTNEEWVWWSEEAEFAAEEALAWNEEQLLVGGWTFVPNDQAQNDPEIQNALNFGIQASAQQGIQDGLLQQANDFSLNQLLSVYQQVVSGINYRFNVIYGSSLNTANATFVVFDQPWTETLQLLSNEIKVIGTA